MGSMMYTDTKYRLSVHALQLAQQRDKFNLRSMALNAIFTRCPTLFTRQQAIDSLRGVNLGSGTPQTFTLEFVKIGYFTTGW